MVMNRFILFYSIVGTNPKNDVAMIIDPALKFMFSFVFLFILELKINLNEMFR